MKWSDGTRPIERFAIIGMVLLALALIVLLLNGCAPKFDLCRALDAGAGLEQMTDDPITFRVTLNREIVAEGVTLAEIQRCAR